MSSTDLDTFKRAAALKAVDYVKDGMVVGLGTGSTAKHMVIALGEKVRAGMTLRGVPTSQETATLAKECGITLIDQENRWVIDVAIDGADPSILLINQSDAAFFRQGGCLLRGRHTAKSHAGSDFLTQRDHHVLGGRTGS